MCLRRFLRVPHADRTTKTKTCFFLSAVLIAFLQLHAIAIMAVSGTLLSANTVRCHFLQPYISPLVVFLTAGIFSFCVCVMWAISMFNKRNTKCLMRVLIVCILTVVALEFISAILAGAFDTRIKEHLSVEMQEDILKINSVFLNNRNPRKRANCWIDLQTTHDCCGGSGYSDWNSSVVSGSGSNATSGLLFNDILDSCVCDGGSECATFENRTVFATSCESRYTSSMETAYTIVQTMASIMALVQLFSFVLFYYIMLKLQTQAVIDVYGVKRPQENVVIENIQLEYRQHSASNDT